MPENSMKVYTQGNPKNSALVFLHAFPLTAGMWKEQIQLFSEKHFCVAPDLPGFGESPLPDHAISLEYYVDSVLQFLRENKIDKATFCGLSMGGYIALRIYERSPELCRALILCDTKAGSDGNEAKLKRWATIQSLQKDRNEFHASQWKTAIGASSQTNAALKERYDKDMAKNSLQGIAAGLIALATRTDSTELLAKIKVPTLILVGEEDKVTPPAESEAMHKAIPGSQLKVITKAGHISNLENKNEFNDHLAEFLKH